MVFYPDKIFAIIIISIIITILSNGNNIFHSGSWNI